MAALSSGLVTTNQNKCRITGSEVVLSFNTTRPSVFVSPGLLKLLLCAKSRCIFGLGTAWRKEGVRVKGVLLG